MKRLLVFLFLITTSAFAVSIDANTQIRWNAVVISYALTEIGLTDSYSSYGPVSRTRNRILENLLQRETFSVAEAVTVCMQECNKEEFLRDGRGDSGRKCPAICEDFSIALIKSNNESPDNVVFIGKTAGVASGKIYTQNRKFYAMSTGDRGNTVDLSSYNFYTKDCDWAIFESSTDTKIAKCTEYSVEYGGEGFYMGNIAFEVTDSKYKDYVFSVWCEGDASSLACDLYLESEELEKYTSLYNDAKLCLKELKEINFEYLDDLVANPVIIDNFYLKILSKSYGFVEESDKFTPDSYELADELLDNYNKYCVDKNQEVIYYAYADTKRCWDGFRSIFKSGEPLVIKHFANFQTKTLEQAKNAIVNDYMWKYDCISKDMYKCTGKCNPIPGTQDYVTCTVGDKWSAVFEFDDICD